MSERTPSDIIHPKKSPPFSHEQVFAELRAWLQTPSSEHWEHVCYALDQAFFHQEERWLHEVALPYVRGRLRDWPHDYLRTPSFWHLTLSGLGHDRPWFEFVRALDAGKATRRAPPSKDEVYFDQHIGTALASSPLAEGLRALDLSGHDLGLDGVQGIAYSALPQSLEILELASANLTEFFVSLLLDVEWPELRALNLAGNVFYRRGVDHVLRTDKLPALESLDVSGCVFVNMQKDDPLARAHEVHPRLKHLGMGSAGLSARNIERFMAHPLVLSLEELGLKGNAIDVWGLGRLLATAGAKNLRRLDLSACKLYRDEDLIPLFQADILPNLRELDISNTVHVTPIAQEFGNPVGFSERILNALMESPALPALEIVHAEFEVIMETQHEEEE
ncbi:MAG: hypothetical protein AAGI01_13810 [Myxococcota bacterium]